MIINQNPRINTETLLRKIQEQENTYQSSVNDPEITVISSCIGTMEVLAKNIALYANVATVVPIEQYSSRVFVLRSKWFCLLLKKFYHATFFYQRKVNEALVEYVECNQKMLAALNQIVSKDHD